MIFCIEDDQNIRELEIYTLEATGMKARGFGDKTALLEALKDEKPELFILDIMLPDDDGISIMKELKKAPETKDIPIIMATAKGSEYDIVQALDTGADDYLVKPFGMMEMVSRVKAVLRRCRSAEDSRTLKYKGITINKDAHRVEIDEKDTALTLKEYQLLSLLIENPGVVFTRDRLLALIWDMTYGGETRTVDMHIKTLREKLGPYKDSIETVRGVGYRMEAL